MKRCQGIHIWSDQKCIREAGHDGPCWGKSQPSRSDGTITRAEWYSNPDGSFKGHYQYVTTYPPNAASKRAFTLLELLACVAIVGLLIGLIAPSLAKSRAAARNEVCKANLRSTGTAYSLYWQQTNEFPIAWSDIFDLDNEKPIKAMWCPADRDRWCYLLVTVEAGPFVRARPEAVAAMDPHTFAVVFDRELPLHPWRNAGYLDGSSEWKP